jgi:hypothetical protein
MIRISTIGLITKDLKTHITMYLTLDATESKKVAETAAIESVSLRGIVIWVSQGQKHYRFTYQEYIGQQVWIELSRVERFATHGVGTLGGMPAWVNVWQKDKGDAS